MQTRSGEKLSFPRPCEAHAKGYRRESKDLRRGTKSAINYVHLLKSNAVGGIRESPLL